MNKETKKNLETDLVIRKASLDVLFLLRSSVDILLSEEDCLIFYKQETLLIFNICVWYLTQLV